MITLEQTQIERTVAKGRIALWGVVVGHQMVAAFYYKNEAEHWMRNGAMSGLMHLHKVTLEAVE